MSLAQTILRTASEGEQNEVDMVVTDIVDFVNDFDQLDYTSFDLAARHFIEEEGVDLKDERAIESLHTSDRCNKLAAQIRRRILAEAISKLEDMVD